MFYDSTLICYNRIKTSSPSAVSNNVFFVLSDPKSSEEVPETRDGSGSGEHK